MEAPERAKQQQSSVTGGGGEHSPWPGGCGVGSGTAVSGPALVPAGSAESNWAGRVLLSPPLALHLV